MQILMAISAKQSKQQYVQTFTFIIGFKNMESFKCAESEMGNKSRASS